MSLAILFHFLCAQHVSDINISIIRSLRLFCWITTLEVLFLVRCVFEFRCGYHSNPSWCDCVVYLAHPELLTPCRFGSHASGYIRSVFFRQRKLNALWICLTWEERPTLPAEPAFVKTTRWLCSVFRSGWGGGGGTSAGRKVGECFCHRPRNVRSYNVIYIYIYIYIF